MATFTSDFWAAAWEEAQERSVIRRSQEASPGRWAAFYERVADLWLELQGDPWRLGTEVVAALAANGIVKPGSRVLDLGSGPGTLAVPLARLGVDVTAVDASPQMTARLTSTVAEEGLRGVAIRTTDWSELTAADGQDIGLAACFPPVASPGGIARLESLSRDMCVVVMGAGSEPFPFRRQIWQRLMDEPLPEIREQLTCLLGHLTAADRRPNLRHLDWPTRLDADASGVREFYCRYFEMLAPERPPAEVAAVVNAVIDPFVRDRRCRAEGRASVALIWWAAGRPSREAR